MSHSFVNRSIDQILGSRKILITCGTGGVGKTTLSAAIALRAALEGKNTVVITIDPAKRLATSLGLERLGDDPTDLTPQVRAAWERAKAKGIHVPEQLTGKLSAIIPDTRQTFETFVRELAPSPALAERVMANPIFQIFAKEFSGANEYMALERLYALAKEDQYDCIILDTPPSRNTLAFLNAPKLLARFFEERMIKWVVLPANRLVATGMRKALGVLEKLTGSGFMTHAFDFASDLFKVQTEFTANLNAIISLLGSSEVGFLMVTTPAPDTAPEVLRFIDTLRENKFHFDGVALNRTLGYFKVDAGDGASASEFQEAFRLIEALQRREKRAMEDLTRNPIPICAQVPELARDVHSVEDLFHVALALDPDLGLERSASLRSKDPRV